MPDWMIIDSGPLDMPVTKWLAALSVTLALVLPVGVAHSEDTLVLKPYMAKYRLLRKGKEHGSAERELFVLDTQYRLRYQSKIEWMIFSDERLGSSEFILENNQVKPLNYQMQRKGTGPDRSYQIIFDRQKRQIKGAQQRRHSADQPLSWNENWLDPISYQQQLSLDLARGKKTFDYQLLDRKGRSIHYRFRLTGEETLTLPYGKVQTVRVERIYQDSENRTLAWFAPQLAYILVRIQKHKAGIEQFEIQLKQLLH